MFTYIVECVILGKEACRWNGGQSNRQPSTKSACDHSEGRLLSDYNKNLKIPTAADVFS